MGNTMTVTFIYLELNRNLNMRLKLLTSVLIVASILLTACETMTVSKPVAVSVGEKWALLPIQNLSKTPLAGNRAKSLVETHLRARGVRNLEIYTAAPDQSIMALLDDAGQLDTAKKWAKDNGYAYGITGSVEEWQYKNGLDNEPSVGLTLKFINLLSDEVMWVASASRTGWGYNNLSNVASKTIEEILAEVRFQGPQPSRMMAAVPATAQPLAAQPLAAPPMAAPPSPYIAEAPNLPPLPPLPTLRPLPTAVQPTTAAALPAVTPTDIAPLVPPAKRLLPSPYETSLEETSNR